jgi:toxin ParE1/3/4
VRIEWKETAREDARQIVARIAEDNVTAAFDALDEIERQVGQLEVHPKLGRAGRVKGTRELVISRTPYIVAYRIDDEQLFILRVVNGARQWPPML